MTDKDKKKSSTKKTTANSQKSLAKYAKDKTVVLETININKTFGENESEVKALCDVSLKIYEGELLVILGSSGSGKSTLLNMLGGMSVPDSGAILFNNEDISQYNDRNLTSFRKKEIGFVFQSFNLINELTSKENV